VCSSDLLLSTALVPAVFACRDRRYSDDQGTTASNTTTNVDRNTTTDYDKTPGVGAPGTVNVPSTTQPSETALGNRNNRTAARDVEDARSTYNVDLTTAQSIAHFSGSGTSDLKGVAAIYNDKMVVAVTDAEPGRYEVHLSSKASCSLGGNVAGSGNTGAGTIDNRNASNTGLTDWDRSGGAADNPGPAGAGTKDIGRGDYVVGYLNVGQDGRGRLEASMSANLVDRTRLQDQTLTIQAQGSENVAVGELRGMVACGEISNADQGA